MTNPGEIHVSSAANPAVKLARALGERRRVRYRERAFLAEGLRVLQTLATTPLPLRVLFLDRERRGELDQHALAALSDAAERVLLVDSGILRLMADTEAPQPILGIVAMPERSGVVDASLGVALDGIRDPGNLGSILRSAVAAGADVIGLLPGTTDPFGPKAVRASAGAVGRAPLVRADTLSELLDATFSGVASVVLADAGAGLEYDQLDWNAPICLVVGGETVGFAPATRAVRAQRVRIPMESGVESLNAGVATAVVLFEAARQRRRKTG
jgi:TrmH family RNA methyltransferase